MSIYELSRYLVVKALAGRRDIIDALYEYFVCNGSPSTIAYRYGLTVNQVRGYIQRVAERTFSFSRARALLRYIYPYVASLKPIVVDRTCRVCGALLHFGVAEEHVRMLHMDVVDLYVEKIVESLLHSVKHSVKARIEVVA